MNESKNHQQIILRVMIFVAVSVNYATCRTAKDFREMPEAAARQSQAQFPSYNLNAPDGPGTYAFGYEIEDIVTGNIQFRDEVKLRNGTVKGSYGVLLPDDTLHVTRYIADHLGYRTSEETRKRNDNGPLKLEVQVQPSAAKAQHLTGEQIAMPMTTYDPFVAGTTTFDTRNPFIDPSLAAAIYQQQQINLRPSYGGVVVDPNNIFDPNNIYNAGLLNQQFLPPIDGIGFRQADNNNNQPGPIIGFFSNLAQNNPLTNFLNNINPFQQQQTQSSQYLQQNQQQQQTPILNFLSNLNPLNLFTNNNNNNNRPQITLPSVAIQSDYVGTGSQQTPVVVMPQPHYPSLSNNIDTSVFSSNNNNDHFLNPTFNYPSNGFNFGGNGPPPTIYSPSYLNNQYATTHRPFSNGNGIRPYSSYLYNNNNQQIPSLFSSSSIYPNPYTSYQPTTSSISPIIALNPLNNNNAPFGYYGNRRKTNKNGKKKNNKNKVDIGDTGSDWFHEFLDKRKEASLDVTSKRPIKVKSSDEDNDSEFEDYFR